jgi:Zinc finger, C2H2 type
MALTVFFTQDAPFLKLGPGSVGTDDVIEFHDGYLELDRDDPRYAEKLAWVRAAANQHRIEELGEDDRGRVVIQEGDEPPGVECPKCGKRFNNRNQLNGHLMSHRNQAIGRSA